MQNNDDNEYVTKGHLRDTLGDFKKELKDELVEEISGLLTDMMANIDMRFNRVEADVADLKADVKELKSDVQVLKKDVQGLEKETAGLKKDMKQVRSDIKGLKKGQQRLERSFERTIKIVNEQTARTNRLDVEVAQLGAAA